MEALIFFVQICVSLMENQLYYRVLDEGTTDSGALVNPVENMETVNLQSAQHFEPHAENVDVCDTREHSSFCSARNEGANESPPHPHAVGSDNVIPEWPCTAFFTPHIFTSAHEVFESFERAGFPVSAISCMQRNQRGEILVTFRTAQLKKSLFH